MYDPTPAPYGDVTRRWTALSDDHRDAHARRLLAVDVAGAHVERPGRDDGAHYRQLVTTAIDGDQIAFAWLATSHRPLLLFRGRALFQADPGEWGATCLELLHTTLRTTVPPANRWLRQSVAATLARRLNAVVQADLDRNRIERPLGPSVSRQLAVDDRDPHPDLSAALECALDQLDPATRDGLTALANRHHLAEVAAAHDISHAALRQRIVRARTQLRPQLASYRRTA